MTLTDESSLSVPAITIEDTDPPPSLLNAAHLFRRLDLVQHWDSEANTDERHLGDVRYQAYQSALSANRARDPASFDGRDDPLQSLISFADATTFGTYLYEVYLPPLTEDHVPQIQDALEQVRTFLRFAKDPTSFAATATVLAEKTNRAIADLRQESMEMSDPEDIQFQLSGSGIQSELSVLNDELTKFESVANVYAPDRLTVNHTWETLHHIVKQSIEDLSESVQEVEADFEEVLSLLGFAPDHSEDSGEDELRRAMQKRHLGNRLRRWGKFSRTGATRPLGSTGRCSKISKDSSRPSSGVINRRVLNGLRDQRR